MTPSEITTQYLTGQLTAAQNTLAHAKQLAVEARTQHDRSKAIVERPAPPPLPEMHAAHHALCVKGLTAATAYETHATGEIELAQARLDAHQAALAAAQPV